VLPSSPAGGHHYQHGSFPRPLAQLLTRGVVLMAAALLGDVARKGLGRGALLVLAGRVGQRVEGKSGLLALAGGCAIGCMLHMCV